MDAGLTKLGRQWYLWITKGEARIILDRGEIEQLTAQIQASNEFLAVVK